MALNIDFSSLPMGVPVAFRVMINYLLPMGDPVALTIDVCRVKKNRKRPERDTLRMEMFFDQGPGRKGQRLGDYAEERVVPNGKKMGSSRSLPQ